jgi:GNAT superfamily N-acetyltransferase
MRRHRPEKQALEAEQQSQMTFDVKRESGAVPAAYADVPIAFEVKEVFDVSPETDGSGRFVLQPRLLTTPYRKDYDAVNREGPARWAERFDVSTWEFFSALSEGHCVGRAAVAYDSPSQDMLEGRHDLAVLWDIRVVPSLRRRGVGAALFHAAVTLASDKGCRHLKVETQNVNAAACRFYVQRGCILRAAYRGAYPEFPDEIQLLWFKDLPPREEAG